MTKNSEYDVIGELFRQKLENHRLPVGADGWNEIERRLSKRKNKVVIWLWSSGAMAAAAAIAMLIVINLPEAEKAAVMTVSQEATSEKPATTNYETNTVAAIQETTTISQPDVVKPTNNVALLVEQEKTENQADINLIDAVVETEMLIAAAENNNETQTEEKPSEEIFQIVNEILKSNNLFFENMPAAKERKKWLLAASIGMSGGSTYGFDNVVANNTQTSSSPVLSTRSSGNSYASNLSASIRPFENMNMNDFTNIHHMSPFSFGIMMHKSSAKSGVESGLVYTYLSSSFEWTDWANYKVQQSLHYIGIPVNLAIYLWNSDPQWRIYISGGFMVEKGLRAVYRQDRQRGNEFRYTTIKSSIDGLQWSLNSSLGINYKLEKGWGIYFEPRMGYGFDCNQPVSIRTEHPVYFGINLGFNYEL